MAVSVATLEATLTVDDQMSPALDKAGQKVESFASSATRAGMMMVGAGAAIVAPLVSATAASVAFERSMGNINSILQVSQDELAVIERGILDIAEASGRMPVDLADAFYNIASSGFEGADAMKILDAAAKAATAGLTTTEVAATAVTAVLNAYSLGADEAARVSDVLFKTVDSGVITFEELAGNIGRVLPVAAALGVGVEEVGAAYAQLTLQGQNASEAETNTAALMRAAIAPTTALSEAVQRHGYETAEALIAGESFIGFLEMLQTESGGSSEKLFELVGNSRSFLGALGLLNGPGGLQGYIDRVKEMEAASEGAGATQLALNEQTETFAHSLDRLKAASFTARKAIGDVINKAVKPAVDGFADLLFGVQNLSPELLTIATIGAALSGVMLILGGSALLFAGQIANSIAALRGLGAALSAARIAGLPLVPVLAGIVAVAALLTAAYVNNWFGFGDAVDSVAGKIRDFATLGIDVFRETFKSFLDIGKETGFDTITAGINAFGRALEQATGLPVAGFFNDLATSVQFGIDTFRNLREQGIEPIEAGFRAVGAAASELLGVDLTPTFDALGASAQQLGNWITGTALPALGQLGSWFLREGLPAIGQAAAFWFGEVIPRGIEAVATTLGFLANEVIPRAFAVMGAAFEFLANEVFPRVGAAIEAIAPVVADAIGGIVDVLSDVDWSGIWDTLSSTASTAWDAVSGAATAAWGVLQNVWGFLSGIDWGGIWGTLSSVGSTVWDAISGAVSGAWNALEGVWGFLSGIDWSGIWGTLETAGGAIWDTITGAVEGASNAIGWLGDNIGPILGRVASAIRDLDLGDLASGALGVLRTVAEGIGGAIGWLADNIPSLLGKVKDAVANFDLGDLASGALGLLQSTVEGIGDAVGWLADNVGSKLSGIADAVRTIDLGDIAGGALGLLQDTVTGIGAAFTGLAAIIDAAAGTVKAALESFINAVSPVANAAADQVSKPFVDAFGAYAGLFDWTPDGEVSADNIDTSGVADAKPPDLGADMVGKIAASLAEADWTPVQSALTTGFGTAVQAAFAGGLPPGAGPGGEAGGPAAATGIGGQVVTSLADGIEGADWSAVRLALTNGFGLAVADALFGAGAGRPGDRAAAGTLGIGTTVVNAIGLDVAGADWTPVQTALQTGFGEAVNAALGTGAAPFTSGAAAFPGATGGDIGGRIVGELATGIAAADWSAVTAAITEGLRTALDAAFAGGAAPMTSGAAAFPGGGGAIGSQIVAGIVAAVQGADWTSVGTAVSQGVGRGVITAGSGTITSALTTILTAAISTVATAVTTGAIPIGTQLVAGAASGIGPATGTFTSAVQAMASVGVDAGVATASAEAPEIGAAVATNAGAGIGANVGTFQSAITAMVDAGIAAGVAAAAGASAIGAAISSGAAAGIDVNALVGPAVQMVNNAIAAAQSAAGAASPSTVARDEVGVPIAQGVAVGIMEGTPLVEQTASDLGSSAVDAAASGMAAAAPAATAIWDQVLTSLEARAAEMSGAVAEHFAAALDILRSLIGATADLPADAGLGTTTTPAASPEAAATEAAGSTISAEAQRFLDQMWGQGEAGGAAIGGGIASGLDASEPGLRAAGEGAARAIAEEIAGIERAVASEIATIERDMTRQRIDVHKATAREIAGIELDMARQRLDLHRATARELTRIEADMARQRIDIERETAREIERLEATVAQSRANVIEALRPENLFDVGRAFMADFWLGMLSQEVETVAAARWLTRRAVATAEDELGRSLARTRGAQAELGAIRGADETPLTRARERLSGLDPELYPDLYRQTQQRVQDLARAEQRRVSQLVRDRNRERVAASGAREESLRDALAVSRADLAAAKGNEAAQRAARAEIDVLLERIDLQRELTAALQRAQSVEGDAQREIAGLRIDAIRAKLAELRDVDVGGAIADSLEGGAFAGEKAIEQASKRMERDLDRVGVVGANSMARASDQMQRDLERVGVVGARSIERAGDLMERDLERVGVVGERAIERATEQMKRDIATVGSRGKPTGERLGEGFVKGLDASGAAEAVPGLIDATEAALTKGAADAVQAAGDAGVDIGDELTTGLQRGGRDAIRTAGQVQRDIDRVLRGVLGDVNLGSVSIGNITGDIRDRLPDADDVGGAGLGTAIGRSIGAGIRAGLPTAADLAGSIKDKMPGADTAGGKGLGTGISKSIAKGIRSGLPTAKDLGEGISKKLAGGITTGLPTVASLAGSIKDTIPAATGPNSVDADLAGEKIGAAAATGIAAGIDENTPAIEKAAEIAMRKAINAAKKESKSKSPSQELARVGRDLMRGLAVGIHDTHDPEEEMRRSVRRLAALADGADSPSGRRRGTGAGEGAAPRTYNFYGDLSFPSAEEFEEFVDNRSREAGVSAAR